MSGDSRAKNRTAYAEAMKNPEWFEKHKGLYVVFSNGAHVDTGEDQLELIEKRRASANLKEQLFVAKVVEENEPITLPLTSLHMHLGR